MPLTTLDPTPALIVIDLQKGIVSIPTTHPAHEVIANAAKLADAFRKANLPVVLVNVAGGAPGRTDIQRPPMSPPPDWSEIVTELHPSATDIRITKHRWGAFLGTDLDQQLRDRGVTQVFMTGIATSIGVESTARCAFDLGYNVVFLTDAMTDRDAEAHDLSIQKIFPRMGEVTTTDEVIATLR